MASQKIIDLSDFVDEPKQIRFENGGEVYKLPADIPVPLYIRLTTLQDEELDEQEATQEIYHELLDLFRIHQPDMEKLPVGMGQLLAIVPRVYGGAQAPEEGGDRPSRGGTKTSKKGKPKRSASTRS